MADNLGALVVRIAADIKELEAGLNRGAATTRTATDSMQSSLDALEKKALGLAKGLAALWTVDKTVAMVREMAMLNARYETLGVSAAVVGKNVGYSAAQMEAAAVTMQKTGISMIESRQAAMQLVQAHIDLADSSRLARVAQDAAVIGNLNSSQAFATLVHGIQSAQTEVLRTIGINVTFEDGYKRTAEALHKNVSALTDNEKMQSRLNQVMEKGKDIAGTYEAAMDTAGKQIKSMERYTEDLKVKQGEIFNESLTIGVMAFTEHLKDANGEIDKMAKDGQLKTWSQGVTKVFAYAVDSALNVVSMLRTVGASTVWLAMTAVDAAKGMTHPFSYESEQANINKAYADMVKEIWSGTGKMVRAMEARNAALEAKDKAAADASRKHTADFKAAMAQYASELNSGLLTQQQYATVVQTLSKAMYGDNHKYADTATTDAKKIAKAHADAWSTDVFKSYASAMDSMAKLQQSATAKADELSKAQTELRDVMGAPQWKAYSRQMQEQIIYAASLAQGEEDRAAAVANSAKAQEELNKAMEASNKTMLSAYEDVLKQAKAEEERAAKIGLTAQQLGVLRLAEIDVLITQQEVAAQTPEIDDARLKGIEMQIAALKRLRAAAKGAIDSQATADLAKEANDSWQKTSEQIGQSLTDQIMAGGKNGFDYLKNLARTTILQPIVKALVSPISAVAAGFMGTAGTAAAGGVAGSAGTGFLGGLGATASGWGTGFANGLSAWGAEGSVTSVLSNASLYSTAEILGALAPIGLGIMALVAISKATSGEMRSGGQYAYNPATGIAFTQGPSGGQIAGTQVQAAMAGTIETINKLLGNVGSAAHLTGFVAGLESSGDNRGGVMAGGTLSTGATFGQSGGGSVYDGTKFDPSKGFNMTSQEAVTAFTLELQQTTIKALQAATDIPKTIAAMLKVDASTLTADAASSLLTSIDAVVTSVNSFNAAAKLLPFANLASLSFDAAAGLIAAAGGLDKLGSNLQTYYQAFYSQEEQRAQTIKNINATVAGSGFDAATATREQFRSLVEAQDVSTESGARMYAALIGVAGAFDQLTPVAQATAAAVVAVGRSLADIASERSRLQDQLDSLTMTSTELLAKQRSALDASNQGLFDQVQAAQAAKDANDALAQTNKGWQDQLDVLLGTQTERSIALRDATDASTRALMEQVYAQQDLKTATEASAAAEKLATAARTAAVQAAAAAIGSAAGMASGVYMTRLDQAKKDVQAAYERERTALQGTASAFADFAKNLRTFRDQVLDTSASLLSPQARTDRAAMTFADVASRARLGDQAAMGAFSGAGQDYLKAAAASASNMLDYQRAVAAVLSSTDAALGVADRQQSVAQQQLDALNKMVGGLVAIEKLLTVDQALANYRYARADSSMFANGEKNTLPHYDASGQLIVPTRHTGSATGFARLPPIYSSSSPRQAAADSSAQVVDQLKKMQESNDRVNRVVILQAIKTAKTLKKIDVLGLGVRAA